MTARRETLVLGATLMLVMIAVAAAFPVLLARPLWLDEVHTLMVAARPTPAQVLADVAAGIDTAPGLLHLVLWMVLKVAGTSAVALRSVPFLCAVAAHLFVFASLRRRFATVPALAGTLAVATQLLVIQMTHEARAYAPWLMLAAGFAWSVGLDAGRRRDLLVGLFAALLCTIHWFGVISLGIMCLAVVASRPPRWRESVRIIAPALAGPGALLLCLPILMGQRAAVTAPSWISEPDAAQIWIVLRTFYLALVPIVALVVVLARLLRAEPAPFPAVAPAALLALAAFPVAILVVSWLVQPSLVDRYLLVTALAWAPLVAYAVEGLGRRAALLSCALLAALGVANYREAIGVMRGFERAHAGWANAWTMAADSSSLPVVFQSRHVQFPTLHSHPRGRERAFYLWLPDSTIAALFPTAAMEPLARFFTFEREAAELHFRRNRYPRLATQAQLDTAAAFLLLGSDASLPAAYKDVERFARTLFPRHQVYRLHPEVTLLQRR